MKPKTTFDLIENVPITLIIFPTTEGIAEGSLYIDDTGDSRRDLENKDFQYFNFKYSSNEYHSLQINLVEGRTTIGRLSNNEVLEEVRILDAKAFADTDFACVLKQNMQPMPLNIEYDEEEQVLVLEGADGDVLLFDDVEMINWGNRARDKTICFPGYSIDSQTVQKSEAGLTEQKHLILSPHDNLLPDLSATFQLVNDNVLMIDIQSASDGVSAFKPIDGVNDTYVASGKPTISLDDVLVISDNPNEFYFEVVTPDESKTVIYSTKGHSSVYTTNYI